MFARANSSSEARVAQGAISRTRNDPIRPVAATQRHIDARGYGGSPSSARGAIGNQAMIRLLSNRGASGQSYEQEADRIADSVTQGSETGIAPTIANPPAVAMRRREEDESVEDLTEPYRDFRGGDRVYDGLGDGAPLEPSIRATLEPRFGIDLSQVRIHTDANAESSARRENALAFTYGTDIVFGTGRYAPHSAPGMHLLAHELTHFAQQRAMRPHIQRQTEEDFRVTHVQPDPQARTQGMADRFFFDYNRSDFRSGVPAEAAEQARLEAWATSHAGVHVQLVGRASQEGPLAHNTMLATQRVETVRGILVARGVIIDSVNVDMTFAQRPVDYRFYRSVEVRTNTTAAVGCPISPAQHTRDIGDCEAAFVAAHARAVAIANEAMSRLRPATDPTPGPAPDRDTVLNDRFPGIARSRLLPLFESIVARLGQVSAPIPHTCNDRCATGCERAAAAGAGTALILCPVFYIPGFSGRTISADERVFAVMHETTHSATVPGVPRRQSVGVDVAYATTRLFGVLDGPEALRNDDSYVMTMLVLARAIGGAPTVIASYGAPPADHWLLVSPPGSVDRNRVARRAIGFAESWLNYASFWSPDLYDFIDHSLTAWHAPGLGNIGHELLELFAPLFLMHHPGTAGLGRSRFPIITAFQTEVAARGFPTPATSRHSEVQDRTRAAAIYDRFTRMHRLLYRTGLTVDRARTGDGSWATGSGLPGLGNTVRLVDSFFTLPSHRQIRHVIRLMARAMSDVGPSWVEAYVEAADGVGRIAVP